MVRPLLPLSLCPGIDLLLLWWWLATNVGDEGGFAPPVTGPIESLDLLVDAIEQAGYTGKIKIGLDVAASEFYDSETKTYNLDKKDPENKNPRLLTGSSFLTFSTTHSY